MPDRDLGPGCVVLLLLIITSWTSGPTTSLGFLMELAQPMDVSILGRGPGPPGNQSPNEKGLAGSPCGLWMWYDVMTSQR